jgi:hypothetical protein
MIFSFLQASNRQENSSEKVVDAQKKFNQISKYFLKVMNDVYGH